MGNKDEFLNRLAKITDNLDELNLKHKKITISIYLENDEYQKMYKIITTNRYGDDDSFSIYIDDYEIIISKVTQ